jgi:NADH-quinone oxidoreductase subunit L
LFPYAPWLVWIAPIVSSLFITLTQRLGGKVRKYFAVSVSLVTAVLALSMIPDVYFNTVSNPESNASWIPWIGINLGVHVDPLSIFFANLIAFFGFVVIIYSWGYMAGEEGLTRYYFFMLLFIGSMIGLVMADNFLQMFIFWEVIGLCSYSLVSFWYKRPEAVRAGIKVFLITRVGDVCFLAAIVLLYINLGSFSFSYTIENIGSVQSSTLTAVVYLMLVGAVAKSAQLPLHTWLYSAMEAPTSVSALLHAATMVKAGVYLIARLILILGPLAVTIPLWLPSIAWVGVLSAVVGATMAIYTSDIKGVLAYSTISQLGFMMTALGTVTAAGAASLGWFASLFHTVSHAFFEGLGFLLAGGIIHALGTRDMRLMGGLRKAMPITFALSIIMILTTSGLPPFASFFSKGLILDSLWSTGNQLIVFIIYAALAATFAYTLRFIILVFMRTPSGLIRQSRIHEPPKTMLYSAGILAVLCFVWGFLAISTATFLHANVEIGFTEIFSPLTLLFLLALLIGGIPVYLFYYRPKRMEKTMRKLAPLNTVFKQGFFFDEFYEKIVAGGITRVTTGLTRFETIVFARLPYFAANSVTKLAHGTYKYFNVLIDKTLYLIAKKTLARSKSGKAHDEENLQESIAAALLGFLIIVIIVIATVLGRS